MFTVADIQKRYQVTEATVLGWIRSGELKALNVGRKLGAKKPRWRIPQAALDAFEGARVATPEAPRTRRQKSAGVIEFYA